MTVLSWNEIRSNAVAFAQSWRTESREDGEAKTFWDGFFAVFGMNRRALASFEAPVKKLEGRGKHRIDLLWKGMLIVEHKSRGKDLGRAQSQAMGYIQELVAEGRRDEVPRYVVLSDFARIALYDLEEEGEPLLFPLSDLPQHVHSFGFIAGYRTVRTDPQDPVNWRAARKLSDLFALLEKGRYPAEDTPRLLTRLLFCLFAEDSGIFTPNAFQSWLVNRTAPDGSDLGPRLAQLFEVLNTPTPNRQTNLPVELAELPYVNGDLFAQRLALPACDRKVRDKLRACCELDWSRISPAVFGSMFQAVLDKTERRQLGAHYTSEKDILRLLRPLFLDDLARRFDDILDDRSTRRRKRLAAFHDELASLHLLDPACGCGNFLVVAYRELRRLETRVLVELQRDGQLVVDIGLLNRVRVGQLHGIECEAFPVEISQVALWLTDHLMNLELSEKLGAYFVRLPLPQIINIRRANALRLDWGEVLAPEVCSYVLGNPPFAGKKEQSAEQKEDLKGIWHGVKGAGKLDYVTCWYRKAADYIRGTGARAAFVSTSSITQGEQPGILWQELLQDQGLAITFAHRTFKWASEAPRPAHVHVVIVGFAEAEYAPSVRPLYEYDELDGEPTVREVKNINPYLVDSPDVFLLARREPLTPWPPVTYGSFALDSGHYTLSKEERDALLEECPEARPYVRAFLGGRELLQDIERYCLWLLDVSGKQLKAMPAVRKRVAAVRAWREASNRAATKRLAETPTRFAEIRQPEGDYIVFPTASSERRRYVPVAMLGAETIASNQLYVVADGSLFVFGVMHSRMHMAWVEEVAGRLKSDIRYSAGIVYNNFPWPVDSKEKRRAAVEAAAQEVLDARVADESLADQYDPDGMRPALVRAHRALDRAVDRLYQRAAFSSDRERLLLLFALWKEHAGG
jgi:hypothetical protein